MNLSPALLAFELAFGKGIKARLVTYWRKGETNIYFQIVGSKTRCYDYKTSIKAIEEEIKK